MRTLDLTTLFLAEGAHDSPRKGMCLLEAASYIAHERFSDHPQCVSPCLANYGRTLNDALPDDMRQRLRPFIPRLIGTAGQPANDQRCGLMAADWLVRTYTPTWLRLAKLTAEADTLAALPQITSWGVLEQVTPTIRAAQEKADAARAAAWAAAWAAARAAAWDAARDAAWAAAWDAARDAAWAAAWAAARAAAWDAARDAARAAAWDAAWAAAWDAARDAAWAAAWDALQPTVVELQESAITLYDRMIALYEVPRVELQYVEYATFMSALALVEQQERQNV